MAITNGDVKILKSQVLLDTDDGGGLMTSAEVVDGVENNLFPDISELDRAYGRISLRKCYPAVLTDTVESYYGATVIVSKMPVDPRVSVCIFTTKDWSDRRSAARNRLEQYLAAGVKWPGHLLETQLEGARAIQLLLKPGDALPEVGRTLMLIENEGTPAQYYQYVRVSKVSMVEREFMNSSNVKWSGVVVTVSITDTLRYTFHGLSPTPYESEMAAASAVCRDTIVADASKYYGISPLEVAAPLGSMQVKVGSIWGQLVPSAQSEIPLSDLDVAGQSSAIVKAGAANCTFTVAWQFNSTTKVFLGGPCFPGTLSISTGSGTITDEAGSLKSGTSIVGAIDYAGGVLTFNTNIDGLKTVNFKPGANSVIPMKSASIDVLANNRGYVWTATLNPLPAPKSLMVSYRSQGKWYDLRDVGVSGGVGVLKGADIAIGTGSVNYSTGSVVLSLGALPDADSKIILYWGTSVTVFDRSGVTPSSPYVKMVIPPSSIVTVSPGVKKVLGPIPGSITVTWPDPSGTGTVSVTDDGNGVFSGGGATGKVIYSTGEISLSPTKLPLAGTTFSVEYSEGEKNYSTLTPDSNITLDGFLAYGSILASSVEITLKLGGVPEWVSGLFGSGYTLSPELVTKTLRVDSLGAFDYGTINLSTGKVHIDLSSVMVPAKKEYTRFGAATAGLVSA